jgi:hypothetical protein
MRPFLLLAAVTATLGAFALSATAASAAPGCGDLIRGTPASERLVVSAAAKHVLGMAGDDRITGGPGRDCLEGGPGRDRVSGKAGADVLSGGTGIDELIGGGGSDRITDAPTAYAFGILKSGNNRIAAGPGADVIDVANARRDIVHCGSGRDRATVDRMDKLIGCERRKVLASPLPSATPYRGGPRTTFLIRFRAIETVPTAGEYFSISIDGPPRCGSTEESSLGIRYRRDAIVRYRAKPFGPDGGKAKRWCRGTYSGEVSFEQVLAGGCGPAALPPAASCTVGVRVGRFSFHVR